MQRYLCLLVLLFPVWAQGQNEDYSTTRIGTAGKIIEATDGTDLAKFFFNGDFWILKQLQVAGIEITSVSPLDVEDGGTGLTTLTANRIPKGNGTSAFSASSLYDDGTNVGSLGNFDVEGLTTISADALIPGTTQTTISAASVNDVFIYDPRLDTDGGEWTHNQYASWYTESGPFPVPAYIYATASLVSIYKPDGTLWKTYSEGGTFPSTSNLIGPSTVSSKCLSARDGILCVGAQGGYGVFVLDFTNDVSYLITALQVYKYNGNLSSTGMGFSVLTTNLVLVNNVVNDVHAQIVNNKLYFAAATDGGVSVINWTNQTVYDYSDVTNDDYNQCYITQDGYLIVGNETQAQVETWYNVATDSADEANGTPDKVWDESSTPALWPSAVTVPTFAGALNVLESGSFLNNLSSRILFGHSSGMVALDNKRADETNGAGTYITNAYNTGPMIGDIRLALPLDTTAGLIGIVSGTVISDRSVKAATFTASNANGTGMAYAAGETNTAIDFDGTDDYLWSYDKNDYSFGDGSTDSAFSVSAWIYLDSVTSAPIVSKYDATTGSELREYDFFVSSGDLYVILYDESANTRIGRLSDGTISAGQWYHVCAVYRGTSASSGIDLYVNGIESDNTDYNSGSYTAMENLSTHLAIGSDKGASSRFFSNGKMDQLTITAEALTASQIKYVYEQGLAALNNHTAPNGLSNAHTLQTLAQGTDSQVNSIALTGDDDLLIGTNTAGLLQYNPDAGVLRVWNVNNVLSASDITAVAAYGIPRSATAEAPGGLIIGVDTTTDYVLLERNQVSLLEALHEAMKQSNQFNEIATDRIFARGGTVPIYVSQSGQLWLGGEIPAATTTTYLIKGKAGTGGYGGDFYNINSSKYAGNGKSFIVEEATPQLTDRASRIRSVKLQRYTRNDWPEPVESKYIFSATEQVPDVTETVYVAEEINGEIQVTTSEIKLDARAQLERDHAKWYQHHINKPQEFGVVMEDLPPEYQDGTSVKFSLMFFEAIAELKDLEARVSVLEKSKVPDHELRIKGLEAK